MPQVDNNDLTICQQAEFTVDKNTAGMRLDQFLVRQGSELPGHSRSMFQGLIKRHMVMVDGQVQKNSFKVRENETVTLYLAPAIPSELVPENVDFEILYEDSDIVVIAKPPGLVVHPASGNMSGTLVHGILYRCKDLSGLNGKLRPGIVHRLDKDTSGVMVVAKNDMAHHCLVDQFKDKSVGKIYHAITDGRLADSSGRIVSQIGRHPVNRKKMAVLQRGGKEAITNWQIIQRFSGNYSLVEINLETGRTHQIRVHMAHIGAPVAGDKVYGKKNNDYSQVGIFRQCLHAKSLTFTHPTTNKKVKYYAPYWHDIEDALEILTDSISKG